MKPVRRFAWLIVCCALGCSVSVTSTDDEYDSELALETLNSALDAWKEGNVKLLVTLDSPIRFVDDDLLAGFRLEDYEIQPPASAVQPFQNVFVTLTLKQGSGEIVDRAAQYQISLEPNRAVLRSDP